MKRKRHYPKIGERVLAGSLAALMVVTSIPFPEGKVYAVETVTDTKEESETEEKKDYIFSIRDINDNSGIKGAEICINHEKILRKTDEKGQIKISSEDMKKIENIQGEKTLTVTHKDYGEAKKEKWTLEKDRKTEISLTPRIKEAWFDIKAYEGAWDGQEHDAVSVKANKENKLKNYIVTYNEQTECPKITEPGSKDVTVSITNKDKKDHYIALEKKVKASVSKKNIVLVFEHGSDDKTIGEPKKSYTNAIKDLPENAVVSYEVDKTDVASVDTKGKVTFKKAGKVKVTARLSANTHHTADPVSYTITRSKYLNPISFENGEVTVTYGKNNNTYKQEVKNLDGREVKYSIINPENKKVASINEKTGEVTIKRAGKVTVKAETTGDDWDWNKKAEAKYTLTVKKGQQAKLKATGQKEITFAPDKKVHLTHAGGSGAGRVTYKLIEGEPNELSEKGELTVKQTGKVKYQITKASNDCYNEQKVTAEIDIQKAEQDGFRVKSERVNCVYGTPFYVISDNINLEKPETNGEIKYSIEDKNNVVENLEGGQLNFTDGKSGEVKVKAEKAGDTNYKSKVIQFTVVIGQMKEKDASDALSIEGDKNDSGWYTSEKVTFNSEGYMLSYNNTLKDDGWKDEIVIDKEGKLKETVIFRRNQETNEIEKIQLPEIKIDSVKPEISVTYETSFLQKVINNVLHLFGKKDTKCTAKIVATDDTSKVKEISYSIDNGKNWTKVTKDNFSEKDNSAVYTVEFSENYKDRINVKAVDVAENEGTVSTRKDGEKPLEENPVVVVDNSDLDTEIALSKEAESKSDEIYYYDKNVSAILQIGTDNFYNDFVEITLKQARTKKDKVSESTIESAFENEKDSEKYTQTHSFTEEGYYDLSMKVNKYNKDTAEKNVKIIIDKTAPEIEIDLPETETVEDSVNYYQSAKDVELFVTEKNFAEDCATVEVTRRCPGEEGFTAVEVKDIKWEKVKKEQDTYRLVLDKSLFDEDAKYKVAFKYKDQASHEAATDTTFVVNKINPEMKISFEDKVKPENKNFYSALRKAKITVTDNVFKPENMSITCADSEKNMTEEEKNRFENLLQDPSSWKKETVEGKYVHTMMTDMSFETDHHYRFNVQYSNIAGRVSEDIAEDFWVDKRKPEGLQISYSDNSEMVIPKKEKENLEAKEQYIADRINEIIYYKDVTVKFDFKDVMAGIDHISYSCPLSENVSDKNEGILETVIERDKLTNPDENGVYTFKIAPQFKGKVKFKAVDRAGNETSLCEGTTTLVADSLAPVIRNSFSEKPNAYRKDSGISYYRNNMDAHLEIDEANFYIEDPDILVEYRPFEKDKHYEDMAYDVIVDQKDGEKRLELENTEKDLYEGTIGFEEGMYRYNVSYTDRSSNKNEECWISETFVIDTTAPKAEISYDNNDVRNGKYFKEDRNMTIHISERNFDPELLEIKVSATDQKGKKVQLSRNYSELIHDSGMWGNNGDDNFIELPFTDEANYKVELTGKDKAGNVLSVSEAEASEAPYVFTVDKTLPTGSITASGGAWTQTWKEMQQSFCYGLWDKKNINLKVAGKDTLSDIESIEYLRHPEGLTVSQVAESDDWKNMGEVHAFEDQVLPDEQFVVYIRLTDKAGNIFYLSSNGMIVDDKKPDIVSQAPRISMKPRKQNINGVYNSNIVYDVKVIDPITMQADTEVFSGLKKVKYEILNQGEKTQSGVFFDFKKDHPSQNDLCREIKDTLTVVAKKNNSNKVDVIVTAEDNAGNKSRRIEHIKIDITAPTINIRYSNNTADQGKYFKNGRTATITVTERNFDPKDVTWKIANKDGRAPSATGWHKTAGTGNGDNTTWTTHVAYNSDGTYTFGMTCEDMCGNKASGVRYAQGTVAAEDFVVDKTVPVIRVSYDNNSFQNNNYYKAARTATIRVVDHNFNPERIKVDVTATDDGAAVSAPGLSGWSTSGDTHTATIAYNADAKYTFTVSGEDKAGNAAAAYERETFFVDKTNPELEITGVENHSANKDEVVPVITYSDTNISKDAGITLTGKRRGEVELKGHYADAHNGRTFTFEDFPVEKLYDDIYTLKASVKDQAGNSTEKEIVFSVNRFGSTYAVDEATKKVLNVYKQEVGDIEISEVNPDKLQNIRITLFKNNDPVVLKKDSDYRISVSGGDGEWFKYTYTIFKKNFKDDAVYRVEISSEDDAGNASKNSLDSKKMDICFAVDKTKPNINITNLKSSETYAQNKKTVNVSVSDNLRLETVDVYLDDMNTPVQTWKDDVKDEISFVINGDSTKPHVFKVVSKDAAGNEFAKEAKNFYVTTNKWVRFKTNKVLFNGTIIGLLAIAGFIIFRSTKKNKYKNK